jgi:hypothetical protein
LIFENERGETPDVPRNAGSLFAEGDYFLAKRFVVRTVSEEFVHQFKHLSGVVKFRDKEIEETSLGRRERQLSLGFHFLLFF